MMHSDIKKVFIVNQDIATTAPIKKNYSILETV